MAVLVLAEEQERKSSRNTMDEDYESCVMMWFIGTVFEASQKSIPQLCRRHFRCYYLLPCMYLSGVAWHMYELLLGIDMYEQLSGVGMCKVGTLFHYAETSCAELI